MRQLFKLRSDNNKTGFLFYIYFFSFLLFTNVSYAQESVPVEISRFEPRDMSRYEMLGLRFDLYTRPEWTPRIERSTTRPSIVVETPENHFPPAEFIITPFESVKINKDDLFDFSVEAIKKAKQQYGRKPTVDPKYVLPRVRGELSGYEIEFEAKIDNIPLTVLYFIGRHRDDNRIIAMSASTLAGRLPHIKEHIRRTFDWVYFLD